MKLGTVLSWIVMLIFSLITLFPFYWMVMTAIMPTSAILARTPTLFPDFTQASMASFFAVFEKSAFPTWMMNSLIVGGFTTVFSIVVSVLAGYSLSRFSGIAQQSLGATLLISKLIPSSLILIPLFIIYNLSGLLDSYIGLILANMTISVPLASWLMKGFFDRIPREIEQAALMDGATQLQALRIVVLPLARPGIAAATVYIMLNSWSEFIFARTLVSSPDRQLLTVGMQSFVGEQNVDWQLLMAAGTVSVLPAIILFIFLEPFLVNGMTKGALAGT